MLRASYRIRRQLSATPGCLRFANVVVSPKEVWTLTVWRTRHEMLEFMRSGAHESIMWIFASWLESFWLMRWRPTTQETGTWGGLQLAQPNALPPEPTERSPKQEAALEAALRSLPRLRAAAGPDGGASIDYAPGQRRARGMVAGAVGGTVRVEVDRGRDVRAAWQLLHRIQRRVLADETALRCAFGASQSRVLYLLGLFRNDTTWRSFMASEEMLQLQRRWPDGTWTMRWEADNEFGHWDGLRLRRIKLGTMIEVPEPARTAASPRSAGGPSATSSG